MYLSAKTIDDLMNKVLKKLLSMPFDIKTSRKESSEITGVMLCLKNPRARISLSETKGTPISALGELLWYLKGTDSVDFIKYYLPRYLRDSEDGKTIYGAYGPRLFNLNGINQYDNIVKLLSERPSSRRATIQIFSANDLDNISRKEIPCTCTLQFFIRSKKLYMVTYMRSNDAFLGLPHDIFAFTMLQEILARELSVGLGDYKHAVGSLHLYEDKRLLAQQYLSEGWQSTTQSMPPMPLGNPWNDISTLLEIEHQVRTKEIDISKLQIKSYWADLGRLLQIHSLFKRGTLEPIEELKNLMSTDTYNSYIEKRLVNSLNNLK